MNRKVTHRIVTIAILVFATSLASLMAQSEEQVERFRKEKEAYYNEKLELSEAEKEDFWRVYNDFHNRKMKFIDEERNTFKYAHKNAENLSDNEINEALDKIRTLKQEQFKLETEYYQNKFPTVLSPKKILKLYKVEWDFRGHLLRKLRNHGHDNKRKMNGKKGADTGSNQFKGHADNHGRRHSNLYGKNQGSGYDSNQGSGSDGDPGSGTRNHNGTILDNDENSLVPVVKPSL